MKPNRIDQYEFPSASSVIKMTCFYISFCPFSSKSLHIHFNPSQNVSSILLLNRLVMVINEGSMLANVSKKET